MEIKQILDDHFYNVMANYFNWWYNFNYGEETLKSSEFILSCLTKEPTINTDEKYEWK